MDDKEVRERLNAIEAKKKSDDFLVYCLFGACVSAGAGWYIADKFGVAGGTLLSVIVVFAIIGFIVSAVGRSLNGPK